MEPAHAECCPLGSSPLAKPIGLVPCHLRKGVVAVPSASANSDGPTGTAGSMPEVLPRTIRIAGAVTTVQAVVGIVFVGALLWRSTAGDLGAVGTLNRNETYGEAGYYLLLALAVLAAGIGLLRGKQWARTPVLLLQLLLIGVAWYAIGPSGQWWIGLIIAVPSIAVLWLLFNREGRKWAFFAGAAPDSDMASGQESR